MFPAGFPPLPHPNHAEGGMVSPIPYRRNQETGRTRSHPLIWILTADHLPEFPAPIYLTTRPDLGDVSQGKLVTIDNYYALFNGS
jgi:hypothetical protein